jgi:RNA polymerase sigma-70 factor, ECF subfamily
MVSSGMKGPVSDAMNVHDDRHLIDLFNRDPKPAFKSIVEKYQDRIFNLCVYMLRDREDARDAAQDVFLKAFRSLGEFKQEASLYTWLYRICVNTCLDYKKKSRPESLEDESFVEDMPSTSPSPEQQYQSKEIGQAIQKALQKLPTDLRATIVLKEIEELSYEEIAKTLGISMGTVKSRISRAREELRRLLQKKV